MVLEMADGDGVGDALALQEIVSDFEVKQRGLLLMAVDKAIDKAMKKQTEMLEAVKSKVEERHRAAVRTLRDDMARQQPSMLETLIARTLNVDQNSGLVDWIRDEDKKQQALECIDKLRSHLEARQGNAFRSDFEALLVVYMEYLQIPMTRGSRLNNRIEDFQEALCQQANSSDDLVNLVFRVRWGCYGVRTVGNARSHDATPLSESEILELCSCFSAIGASMPTLSFEFDVCKAPVPSPSTSTSSNDVNGGSGVDLATLVQLRQLTGQAAIGNADQASFDLILQLLANGINVNNGNSAGPKLTGQPTPPPPLPPGFSNSDSQPPLPPGYSDASTPPLPPGYNNSQARGYSLRDNGLSSDPWRRSSPHARSPHAPPQPTSPGLARHTAPTDSWRQPSAHANPQAMSPHAPPPPPPSTITTTVAAAAAPGFAKQQSYVPTQAALALIPTYKYYHDRPTDLPRETDRVKMAMFARMINHMSVVPKASLCPFQAGHDPACERSHSYLEVMSYNPLFKRLICRQPSHYWSSHVHEDENCICIHVDTGLTWEWMDDARDKRAYCVRGSKCTNNKCYKSHSFEEMCWYNPAYKIKKCAVRAHDHIVRARGTIEPPLDCNFYHIEEGRNADKRDLIAENDHVGRNVKMLFVERTHKPLADALEALRYANANNL